MAGNIRNIPQNFADAVDLSDPVQSRILMVLGSAAPAPGGFGRTFTNPASSGVLWPYLNAQEQTNSYDITSYYNYLFALGETEREIRGITEDEWDAIENFYFNLWQAMFVGKITEEARVVIERLCTWSANDRAPMEGFLDAVEVSAGTLGDAFSVAGETVTLRDVASEILSDIYTGDVTFPNPFSGDYTYNAPWNIKRRMLMVMLGNESGMQPVMQGTNGPARTSREWPYRTASTDLSVSGYRDYLVALTESERTALELTDEDIDDAVLFYNKCLILIEHVRDALKARFVLTKTGLGEFTSETRWSGPPIENDIKRKLSLIPLSTAEVDMSISDASINPSVLVLRRNSEFVNEGQNAVWTLSRLGEFDLTQSVTARINYSWTGPDRGLSGSSRNVTIAANQTTAQFSLTTTDDVVVSDVTAITASIAGAADLPAGYQLLPTLDTKITVRENDSAQTAFWVTGPDTVTQADGATYQIRKHPSTTIANPPLIVNYRVRETGTNTGIRPVNTGAVSVVTNINEYPVTVTLSFPSTTLPFGATANILFELIPSDNYDIGTPASVTTVVTSSAPPAVVGDGPIPWWWNPAYIWPPTSAAPAPTWWTTEASGATWPDPDPHTWDEVTDSYSASVGGVPELDVGDIWVYPETGSEPESSIPSVISRVPRFVNPDFLTRFISQGNIPASALRDTPRGAAATDYRFRIDNATPPAGIEPELIDGWIPNFCNANLSGIYNQYWRNDFLARLIPLSHGFAVHSQPPVTNVPRLGRPLTWLWKRYNVATGERDSYNTPLRGWFGLYHLNSLDRAAKSYINENTLILEARRNSLGISAPVGTLEATLNWPIGLIYWAIVNGCAISSGGTGFDRIDVPTMEQVFLSWANWTSGTGLPSNQAWPRVWDPESDNPSVKYLIPYGVPGWWNVGLNWRVWSGPVPTWWAGFKAWLAALPETHRLGGAIDRDESLLYTLHIRRLLSGQGTALDGADALVVRGFFPADKWSVFGPDGGSSVYTEPVLHPNVAVLLTEAYLEDNDLWSPGDPPIWPTA